MDHEQFSQIAERRIESCRQVLVAKAKEYSRNGDRLHNFKRASAMDGTTPARSLWGMWKKHLVSIADMIDDLDAGKVPSKEMVTEKLGDNINYSVLLEGLIEELREMWTIKASTQQQRGTDPLAAAHQEEWEEMTQIEDMGTMFGRRDR